MTKREPREPSVANPSERTIAGERSHPDRMPERTMTSDRSQQR